jgi:hypothetical protein
MTPTLVPLDIPSEVVGAAAVVEVGEESSVVVVLIGLMVVLVTPVGSTVAVRVTVTGTASVASWHWTSNRPGAQQQFIARHSDSPTRMLPHRFLAEFGIGAAGQVFCENTIAHRMTQNIKVSAQPPVALFGDASSSQCVMIIIRLPTTWNPSRVISSNSPSMAAGTSASDIHIR